MIYIVYFLTVLIMLPTQIIGMYTTFSKPTYWLEKPRYDRRNMTSYESTYYHAWASKSFDKDGNKVPLLTFANPEPLLASFLHKRKGCTYNKIDKQEKPISYAIFDGKYAMNVLTTEVVQNFHENFFVQINIPIGKEYLKDISITPTNACGDSIKSTEKIDNFIEELSLKLFKSPCCTTQERSYIGPSFLLFGLTKSLNNFVHIDMLDVEFKTGVIFPVKTLETEELSLFPETHLHTLGIPFQFKLMIGAYDWLNFGVSSAAIFHIKRDTPYHINQHPYPNKLIIPAEQSVDIAHYPLITFTTYLEGEYFLPHWSWYVGFNFVKQYKTTLDICTGTNYENNLINKYPTQLPWQQGALTVSSEFDFGTEEKRLMPRCRISYIKRIFGKNCFDSAVIAGQVGFEVLYDF